MATWKEPKNDYVAEDQVVPEIFNTLAENERYLQEQKIITDQVQDAMVSSTQSSTRESIGDKESVKGIIGKIRKWLADLKALAFKSTVATGDIDNSAITTAKINNGAVTTDKINASAVTTAKIADGAVKDAKIESVSASKVTGLATVATSGNYYDLTDRPEIPGESGGYTFIVNSDEQLAHWANNDSGYDYTYVLIKTGTWSVSNKIKFRTYSSSENACGVNLSQTGTKVVVGENGSKLYFSVDTTTSIPVRGLAYEYGDYKDGTDGEYFMYNVTVHSYGSHAFTSISTSAFVGCANMINCRAISENGYEGYGFSSCYHMIHCFATVSLWNNAAGYQSCKGVTECVANVTTNNATRKWLEGSAKGFSNCETVQYCKACAISIPATDDYTGYAFSSCCGVYRCKKSSSSSTGVFKLSYFSNSKDSTYACDDTLNGGFNDTTN